MTLKINFITAFAIPFFQHIRRLLQRLMAWTGKGRSAVTSCRS